MKNAILRGGTKDRTIVQVSDDLPYHYSITIPILSEFPCTMIEAAERTEKPNIIYREEEYYRTDMYYQDMSVYIYKRC